MTVGAIAGLIAAIAFVALVALAAVPLLKLGRVWRRSGWRSATSGTSPCRS